MLELWYNADMDAETPLYYIYQDKQRIGWIKNVDKEGYIDAILIYKDYLYIHVVYHNPNLVDY